MKKKRSRNRGKMNWKGFSWGAGIVLAVVVAVSAWMRNSFWFSRNPVYVRSDASGNIKFWGQDATGNLVVSEQPIQRQTGSLAGRQIGFTAGKTRAIEGVAAVAIHNNESASGITWVERSKVTLNKPKA